MQSLHKTRLIDQRCVLSGGRGSGGGGGGVDGGSGGSGGGGTVCGRGIFRDDPVIFIFFENQMDQVVGIRYDMKHDYNTKG